MTSTELKAYRRLQPMTRRERAAWITIRKAFEARAGLCRFPGTEIPKPMTARQELMSANGLCAVIWTLVGLNRISDLEFSLMTLRVEVEWPFCAYRWMRDGSAALKRVRWINRILKHSRKV
jgi:hypothetical protein